MLAMLLMASLLDVDLEAPSLGFGGVAVADAADALKRQKIIAPPTNGDGVLVLNVSNGGPAAVAGLKAMDVLYLLDGKRVKRGGYLEALAALRVGMEYPANVYRFQRSGRKRWQLERVTLRPMHRGDVYVRSLTRKKDEIRELTFLRHPGSETVVNSVSDLHAYIVEKDGKPIGLRLHIQYVADDWLFIEKFQLRGTKTHQVPAGLFSVERDNSGGKIWEWFDVAVDQKLFEALRDAVEAEKAILRCEGRQYSKDRELSTKERERLRIVLSAWSWMGGKL